MKALEYQCQQGIEHIQPGLRSMSSQMLRAHHIVDQQKKDRYENQQGIEYIQLRIRSVTSQVLQTLEYEIQQGIEYIQGKMKSTTNFKLSHTHEFETYQQIDYIQPKQRPIVISEVNQQVRKANNVSRKHANQAIEDVLLKEKLTKEITTEHENQQDTKDIYLEQIFTVFPELRFSSRSLKSYEHLNS